MKILNKVQVKGVIGSPSSIEGALTLPTNTQIGATTINQGAAVTVNLPATAGTLLTEQALNNTPLTGTPTAPTAVAGTSTTQIATTEFVSDSLSLKAPIANPVFDAPSGNIAEFDLAGVRQSYLDSKGALTVDSMTADTDGNTYSTYLRTADNLPLLIQRRKYWDDGYEYDAYTSVGVGENALKSSVDEHNTAVGYNTAEFNLGYNVTALGSTAGQKNTGWSVDLLGRSAGITNNSTQSVGAGGGSLTYGQGTQNTAVGVYAYGAFIANVAGAKTFDAANLNVTTYQVTITAHGFGSIDSYILLKYTANTGTRIGGLSLNTVFQAKIIDANTIEILWKNNGINIYSQGTGTHTFTPAQSFTNTTSLGYNTAPTKNNQVILGNVSVTDFRFGTQDLTKTELGHLSGVTSGIQTQLNGKASSSHEHTISDVTDLQTAIDNAIVPSTTTNITYYVATTGSDSNDGLTIGTPFRTIQHAIDLIPDRVIHDITINILDGDYQEYAWLPVRIRDYGGSITIKNNTVVNFTNLSTTLAVKNYSFYIDTEVKTIIRGIEFNDVDDSGINGTKDAKISVINCISRVTASHPAIWASGCKSLSISSCTFTNKSSFAYVSNTFTTGNNNYGESNGIRYDVSQSIVMETSPNNIGTDSISSLGGAVNPISSTDSRLTDARTPLTHAHAISDVTGLQTALTNIELTAIAMAIALG